MIAWQFFSIPHNQSLLDFIHWLLLPYLLPPIVIFITIFCHIRDACYTCIYGVFHNKRHTFEPNNCYFSFGYCLETLL